jgi:hypothetical protein
MIKVKEQFDEEVAKLAVQKLKDSGYQISEGLTDDEVKRVEVALSAHIPPDLKLLLLEGVPISEGFRNWHEDPQKIIADSQDAIEQSLMFDIEQNDYWHESFSDKPKDIEDAKQQALAVVRTWPALMPIYAHRFITTNPQGFGNPVISVSQAVDSIYYGYNLADYLRREFEISLPVVIPKEPPRVPYWGDAFDLFYERY